MNSRHWFAQRNHGKLIGMRIFPAGLLALLIVAFVPQGKAQQLSSGLTAESELPEAPLPQGAGRPLASAMITGTVLDANGQNLSGAQVILEDSSSHEKQTAETDDNGSFAFAAVRPGNFHLTVSADGFAPKTLENIATHSGQSYNMSPITLRVAIASSTMDVTLSQQEVAEEEIKVEEKQRILGVLPNFYIVYGPDVAPLTTKQKFKLAWRSSIDPFNFAITGLVAGVEQADDSYQGYGQGAAGYGQRYAATYGDSLIGAMVGAALIPSVLHQDPRYFYKGTGTVRSRVAYALAFVVRTKGDNGRWQPNYSFWLGNFATAGISNLYYPSTDRDGASTTIENVLIGTAESGATNLFQEFVIKKFTPHAGQRENPEP